ncbi:MAG: ankyrin repeat domain-containing protein [Bdellovibrionota bacterium]
MTPQEAQKLVFNSIFDCLTGGQEKYRDVFFYTLEKIMSLNEHFSDEELFLKITQLASSKVEIDVFKSFLNKIQNPKKILKTRSLNTGNNILHIILKNKVDNAIIKICLDLIEGDPIILNQPNKQGDTPLHFAVKYARKLSTVDLLLKHNISLYSANRDKNTPFHYSVMLLTHNREFDLSVFEQQMLIFSRFCSIYKKNSLHSKNKYGNTVLHQMVTDIDFYQGVTGSKKIYEFFHSVYPIAIQNMTTKLKNIGVNLREKNNLNATAFQLAFMKKHFFVIKSLYDIGSTITKQDLCQNNFEEIVLELIQDSSQERFECIKVFVLAGGHVALKNTQLGHAVLKYALIDHLNIELTDLLITKAGARILENGDGNEIWKSLFFKLNHTSDFHFKVNTLKILFHIGVDYTSKDIYGREAEDLAKLYHMHDEFMQAKQQFEVYSLTQEKMPIRSATLQQYFYH